MARRCTCGATCPQPQPWPRAGREDIDFENNSIRVWEGYAAKQKGKPKSRKSRTVPMEDKVAKTLKQLKHRPRHTANKDHVFAGRDGSPLDGSALRRRYIRTLDAACGRRTQREPVTA